MQRELEIRCTDCNAEVGTTTCEITATSFHLCESCHDADLAVHE